jgi:hypothetical protein
MPRAIKPQGSRALRRRMQAEQDRAQQSRQIALDALSVVQDVKTRERRLWRFASVVAVGLLLMVPSLIVVWVIW